MLHVNPFIWNLIRAEVFRVQTGHIDLIKITEFLSHYKIYVVFIVIQICTFDSGELYLRRA